MSLAKLCCLQACQAANNASHDTGTLTPSENVRSLPFISFASTTSFVSSRFVPLVPQQATEAYPTQDLLPQTGSMRFYASAILRTPAGLACGSLSISDAMPRHLTVQQRSRLQARLSRVPTRQRRAATPLLVWLLLSACLVKVYRLCAAAAVRRAARRALRSWRLARRRSLVLA